MYSWINDFPTADNNSSDDGFYWRVEHLRQFDTRRSVRMEELTRRTSRPWKVVAQEVAHESDPAKLTELIAELIQALDEQGIGKPDANT
jgi:DNA topoisomerase IA